MVRVIAFRVFPGLWVAVIVDDYGSPADRGALGLTEQAARRRACRRA